MNSAIWLPTVCALVLILTGCTPTKTAAPGSGPNGTGPFNGRGEYVEAWADDPSKWPRPGNRQPSNDIPVIVKTEEPPPNSNPLLTQKPPTREPFVTTKVEKSNVKGAKPKSTVVSTTPKPTPKPTAKPKPKVSRYVVKKGDTLSAIASRQGSSVAAIRKANSISGSIIRPGQSLVIPKR